MPRPVARPTPIALALPLAATLLAVPGSASAEGVVERAAVSCLTGATLSGVTTAFLAAPLFQSGPGSAVAISAVTTSAGVGCGVGLVWSVTATGYSWAWRTLFGGSEQMAPSRRPLPSEAPAKDLIHAELP